MEAIALIHSHAAWMRKTVRINTALLYVSLYLALVVTSFLTLSLSLSP